MPSLHGHYPQRTARTPRNSAGSRTAGIGHRDFALRRADNQLCLDTAAPQSHRNGEVNQPLRTRCDVGTIPETKLSRPVRLISIRIEPV